MLKTIKKIQRQLTVPRLDGTKHLRYFSWALLLFGLVWAVLYFTLSSNPIDNFKAYYPLIGLGFATGILANISAVGGGIIFIPVMLFNLHFPAVMALKISLGTQSIGLVSGAIAWYRTGKINNKALLYAVPGLLIGSTISSLVIHPNALLIKTIFGPVSILIGIITILMLNKAKERSLNYQIKPWPLFLISIIGGLITGWISIGEGELIAAYLMLACGFGAASSIGIGVVLLAINSIYLTLIHNFLLGGIPWHIAAFTILGAVYGARLAPYLSQWISAKVLKIIFSIIAIGDGIIFLTQVFSNHSLR